jgi:hypothetical protein
MSCVEPLMAPAQTSRGSEGEMLSEEDLFVAARAAALAGVEPTAWLTGAIRHKAKVEERHRRCPSRVAPGPWPGWTTETFDNGWVMHRRADGMEISFMPRRLQHWSGTSLRPWAVRTIEGMLRSRTGRIRTFATEYAAKIALDRPR